MNQLTTSPDRPLGMLATTRSLKVKQVKEWGEILTGFETTNRYQIADDDGRPFLVAGETGGGLLAMVVRMFLKAKRPFTMEVRSLQNRPVLTVDRPFRFFFSAAHVTGAEGEQLGTIQQKFKLFGRLYEVLDSRGAVMATLQGPFFKPWTFVLKTGAQELGSIKKVWSGLGKEMFTDADSFGLELSPALQDPTLRLLLLGATFLIDFVHFEDKSQ